VEPRGSGERIEDFLRRYGENRAPRVLAVVAAVVVLGSGVAYAADRDTRKASAAILWTRTTPYLRRQLIGG
jgi:hypothetical protein